MNKSNLLVLVIAAIFAGVSFNATAMTTLAAGETAAAGYGAGTRQVETFVAEVFQLDTEIGGVFQENRQWGMVDISFIGSPDILYFNLAYQGQWLIQNMPVLSSQGADVFQTQSFGFDLGIPDGVDVPVIDLSLSLTEFLIQDPPLFDEPYAVQPRGLSLDSGHQGIAIQAQAAAGQVMIGGPPVAGAVVGPSIVNQECGKRECVPAAVSNALMFLNDHHGLGIDPELISIDALKTALAWVNSSGCNILDWPRRKNQYLRQHNIPISTRVVRRQAIQSVITALNDGCVVEMNVPGHTVLVTGVTKLPANNRYTIEVAHDTNQGQVGGTRFQSMTYKSSSGRLDGVCWARRVYNFVIECPTND